MDNLKPFIGTQRVTQLSPGKAGQPSGSESTIVLEAVLPTGVRPKDIDARWRTLRQIRESGSFVKDNGAPMTEIMNVPNADIYVVDVSFKALKDKSQRDYLNQLPTSFALPDEAVDRLRAAARTLILTSTDLQQALRDEEASIVDQPVTGTATASSPVATPTATQEAK